ALQILCVIVFIAASAFVAMSNFSSRGLIFTVTLVAAFCAVTVPMSLVFQDARRLFRQAIRDCGYDICMGCGYDLRATTESSACPECGRLEQPPLGELSTPSED
ncbi:MAG: hypothetical protein AAF432_13275, partial [Planctomycetota bacterium]